MAGNADIGPKAASLRRLADAGLPVPEARFLGLAAYREHARRAGLGPVLERAAGVSLDAAVARKAIVDAAVDDEVERLLRSWHAELGGGQMAVRSSGSAEDLPGASFAGQHGTYFVSGADELVDRVRDCWASLFSERAVRYRESHGIPHADVEMAVIVQRLVPAQSAGVVFTADPMDGTDSIWLEACPGIGEALVSGKVTPDRYVFERGTLAVEEVVVGDKRVRIVAGPDATSEEPIDEGESGLCLDETTARDVVTLALRAEDAFGIPVDVEWAFDGERVWLLQARPITTGRARAEAPPAEAPLASGTAASAGPVSAPVAFASGTVWSNVNTGEILPDVATPLTWTILHGHADQVFAGMFGALGVRVDTSKLIGLVGGRIYFNLSMLRESFRHLPGVDPDIALGGMHDGAHLPPSIDEAPTRSRLLPIIRALMAMPGYVLGHRPKNAPRFAAYIRNVAETNMRAAAAGPDADEAYRLVRDLDAHFDDFNDALAYMAVAMFGYGMLGTLTDRWFADKTGAIATRLVAGQGGVVSAESGHALWRLSTLARSNATVRGPVLLGAGWIDVRERLQAEKEAGDAAAAAFLEAWDSFMTEYGHHRRGELEFGNPTWAERPDYVLGIVRGYATHGAEEDPVRVHSGKAADADLAASECRARLRNPVKRAVFDLVLRWGRASARTRENIKSEAVRWLVAIRYALLALGRRMVEAGVLADPEDIFFVEYGEIEGLVHDPGARDWRALVASRRAEHERLEKLSPPPVVVGEWDESSAAWSLPADVRTLKGIPVSSGIARGRARVFLSAET
ncbi:MAG TPA: PEP/pyruvate-binding domain-containing protein, partial [Coriobacteriia bacterium]